MKKQFEVGQKVELIGCFLPDSNRCKSCSLKRCHEPERRKIGVITARSYSNGYVVKFQRTIFDHGRMEFSCSSELLAAADVKMSKHIKALNV